MQFGICVASRPADLDYIVEAERSGFTHCWMADSQMIWSDVYAMLALAAERTSTMRIGTGVAVAGTRPSSVTAAALATINEIAPGRVFCGVGSGNTAMRIMGHKPMPIAEFDRYLGELRSLLDGRETTIRFRGVETPVVHLMPDDGFVRFEPRIPMHVSAFGPRSLELAARHGDGLITSAPPVPDAIAGLRDRIPRRRHEFPIATLTTIVVTDEGEPLDSERVRRQAGAFAIAGVHYAYDQYLQYGRRPPAHMADFWDDYVALVEDLPAGLRHQRVHQGHNCWVVPDEERFVTAELIERSCLVGTPTALADRIAEARRCRPRPGRDPPTARGEGGGRPRCRRPSDAGAGLNRCWAEPVRGGASSCATPVRGCVLQRQTRPSEVPLGTSGEEMVTVCPPTPNPSPTCRRPSERRPPGPAAGTNSVVTVHHLLRTPRLSAGAGRAVAHRRGTSVPRRHPRPGPPRATADPRHGPTFGRVPTRRS